MFYDVTAECVDVFKCLPVVADAISRRKRIFCHVLAVLITFYVNSALLLRHLSCDYGQQKITF